MTPPGNEMGLFYECGPHLTQSRPVPTLV